MLFVGTYEHTIDAKQRLAIPSRVRDRLDPEKDGGTLYAVVQEGPTLCLYTQQGFEKRAEDLDNSERSAEEILLFEQIFYSNSEEVEMDKQGRVRLPERLLKMAGLDKEIVIIGVKDHLEIHDRQEWNKRVEQVLTQRPDLLTNPRRLMKAPAQPGSNTGP